MSKLNYLRIQEQNIRRMSNLIASQSIHIIKDSNQNISSLNDKSKNFGIDQIDNHLKQLFRFDNQKNNQFMITDYKQYIKMKQQCRDKLKKYFFNEINMIKQQEKTKYRQKQKIKQILQNYNNPLSKQRQRMKHHERVEQNFRKLRQKEKEEQIQRLDNFLKKKEQINNRVDTFFNSKYQKQNKLKNHLLQKQQMNQQLFEKLTRNRSIKKYDKTLIRPSTSVCDLRTDVQQKWKQKMLQRYIQKMYKAQQRLIKLSIKKYKQSKKKQGIICLTKIRNQRIEQRRKKNQLDLDEKLRTFTQNMNKNKMLQSQYLQNRQMQQNKKMNEVLQKKQNLLSMSNQKILNQYQLKKQKYSHKLAKTHQNTLSFKKHFIIKKQKQKNQFYDHIHQINRTIHNIKILKSNQNLPIHTAKSSFSFLTKQIGLSSPQLQILQKTKQQIAAKQYNQIYNKKIIKK